MCTDVDTPSKVAHWWLEDVFHFERRGAFSFGTAPEDTAIELLKAVPMPIVAVSIDSYVAPTLLRTSSHEGMRGLAKLDFANRNIPIAKTLQIDAGTTIMTANDVELEEGDTLGNGKNVGLADGDAAIMTY
jgi:MoaA/NifB/PqqE/SkfB family radical SAM enzyme